MRTAYEKQFGRLLAEEIPSKVYMGVKTLDVEEGEPRAEKAHGGLRDFRASRGFSHDVNR
eukprot:4093489-Karenia_brevis.AAC.1